MKASTCSYCESFKTAPTALDFPCAVCGQRMHELVVPDDPGLVFHCPRHCTTLLPSPSMLADAQARSN
jgi:hypothetical protein